MVCFKSKSNFPALLEVGHPNKYKPMPHTHILPETNSSHLKMDGWNIVPFGMAYIQVRTVRFRVYYNRLFFSAKERLTSGLSVEAELRRSGGGSLDARGGSTSLVAWWEAWLAVCLGPGGRKARMKPITYTPSCHLKLPANAPKNRQSQKETHLPSIHCSGANC